MALGERVKRSKKKKKVDDYWDSGWRGVFDNLRHMIIVIVHSSHNNSWFVYSNRVQAACGMNFPGSIWWICLDGSCFLKIVPNLLLKFWLPKSRVHPPTCDTVYPCFRTLLGTFTCDFQYLAKAMGRALPKLNPQFHSDSNLASKNHKQSTTWSSDVSVRNVLRDTCNSRSNICTLSHLQSQQYPTEGTEVLIRVTGMSFVEDG